MNTINLFHENMKLADMLNENPQLILMLPRFDIRLGFGEKRIREVCEGGKVPVGLFLLLCNVYTFDFYLPTGEEVESIDGKALISYLQASHRYYLVKRLSHIGTHIDHIADVCGDVGSVLRKFFSEYRKEVEAHFSYEEDTVFPYILRLLDGMGMDAFTIKEFERAHSNIEDKLSDLTNIIVKYLPAETMPDERISVWFDITQVSRDLNKHALIEEKILVPYVKHLEENRHE
ncbi:MAG: hemerythrin domain-containing protein [Paludibacteraceae bacterium]